MRCQLLAKRGAHMVDAACLQLPASASLSSLQPHQFPAPLQVNELRWPRLTKMVKQYFSAPASSAGVERVFSAADKMHSDLRKSLGDSSLQHSIFACFNTE